MAGRKRASSADQAHTPKRPKADRDAAEAVGGNKPSGQTPRSRRKCRTSVSARGSQKKQKVEKNGVCAQY